MKSKENVLLKINYPKWALYFISFCWGSIFLFFIFFALKEIIEFSFPIQMVVIICAILLSGVFIFKIFFLTVIATEKELKRTYPFITDKSFPWDEIIEVRRPRLGMPYDFSYVISKNKKKLLLIRSMENYKELVELIKAKAPNLQNCKS